MSDLQIGLLILGLLIVGGVIAFNWVQERQFHQQAEQGFERPNADLLLDPQVNPGIGDDLEKRIDPHFEPQFEAIQSGGEQDEMSDELEVAMPETATLSRAPAEGGAGGESASDESDSTIGYVAEIKTEAVVPATTIDALIRALESIGRRYKLSGYDFQAGKWESVSDLDHLYTSIRVFIQVVDRSGVVTREQLEQVSAFLREHADSISGMAVLPDIDDVLSTAAALDEFCVNVDVIVGLSVISQPGQVLHGTQLRALAEAKGLRLNSNGVFVLHDAQGGALFTMDNQESNPFDTAQLKNLVTHGVTFLLDVPRTGDGLKVFNKMVAVGRQFADALDGVLCDDNRVLLNDSGLEKIRSQLRTIYETMDQRGISAGGETARNLFS